jgi:hypothetical protein
MQRQRVRLSLHDVSKNFVVGQITSNRANKQESIAR